MNNSQTVYLNSFSPLITGTSPYTLTLIPSGVSLSSKVYKITYDFGDGNIIHDVLSPDNNPLKNTSTNVYYLTGEFTKAFNVKTYIYKLGTSSYDSYSFSLDLSVPKLEGIDTLSQTLCSNYFSELHLVGSRMFGPNNDILYIFESITPNYLIPVSVNWKPRPPEPIMFVPIKDHYRPYKLLAPFENELINSAETGTDIILINPVAASPNPDDGSPDMTVYEGEYQ
jgi:hypothetical protein